MAIKIGKFYITRNNPRELLRTIADKQNIIDKAIKYLKQPYRDNFDYSKAELINILESDEQ